MSEVKIYTIESDQLSPPVTGEGFCVDLVRHSDYAALAAELKQSQIDLACYKHGMEQSNKRLTDIAAENVVKQEFIKTCFQIAAEGGSLDGADIQELGERLGLFNRETYQPALHGYICGHEAGEDTVYVMKKSPNTDAWVNEQRAAAVEYFSTMVDYAEGIDGNGEIVVTAKSVEDAARAHAAKLRGSVENE